MSRLRKSIRLENPGAYWLEFELDEEYGLFVRYSEMRPAEQEPFLMELDFGMNDAADLYEFLADSALGGQALPPDHQPREWGCAHCVYWAEDRERNEGKGRRFGRCVRRAPATFGISDGAQGSYAADKWAGWPLTDSGDWCGDWKWRTPEPGPEACRAAPGLRVVE